VGETEVTTAAPPAFAAAPGGAPEVGVALDMIRRSVKVVPILVLGALLLRGFDGAASAAYGVAIVLANFALAAAAMAWAGRVSLGLLAGAAMFGFLIRLGLIFLAVYAVQRASWVDFWVLGFTLIVTHLGLLFWEMRYVSLSLAYPGVKPAARRS
jgi:branched-subunit amino acid transport protein AzlD